MLLEASVNSVLQPPLQLHAAAAFCLSRVFRSLYRSPVLCRCARCNGEFIPEPLPRGLLPEGHGVPPGILATVEEYWVCGRCRRVSFSGPGLECLWEKLRASRCRCAAPTTVRASTACPLLPPAAHSGVYWQGSQYGRAKKEMNDLIAKLKALV